jgi:putative ABC transport system permease protein
VIPVLAIARQSAWNRRATLSLVALSIALSTVLLLGFARMRADVRESFSQSVSGTDLIVGARTGAVQLLLYAVFRVGGATNNVRMASLEEVAKNPAVAWMVPLSLGDSHRGFPVLATATDYFARFLYGDRQALRVARAARSAARSTACTRPCSAPRSPTRSAISSTSASSSATAAV